MDFKFFILEDDPIRMDHFNRTFARLKGEGINIAFDHTDKASEAIDLISNNTYDVLLLDHDLGGEIFVDTSHKNTGSEVARFINSSKLEFKNTKVIIHSLNTPAALSMKGLIESKIQDTHYIPRIWFDGIFTKVFAFSNPL